MNWNVLKENPEIEGLDFGEDEFFIPDEMYDHLDLLGWAPEVLRIGEQIGPFLIYGIAINGIDVRLHPSYKHVNPYTFSWTGIKYYSPIRLNKLRGGIVPYGW